MSAPAIPMVRLCPNCGKNPVTRKVRSVFCGPCELNSRPSGRDRSRDYTVTWAGWIDRDDVKDPDPITVYADPDADD